MAITLSGSVAAAQTPVDTVPQVDTTRIVQCSLANGDRLSGSFLSYDSDTLRVQTKYAAEPIALVSKTLRQCTAKDSAVISLLGSLVPHPTPPAPSWPSTPAVVSLGTGTIPSLLTGNKIGWHRVMTFSYGYSSGNTNLADLSLSSGIARLTPGSRSQLGGYLRKSRRGSTKAADLFSFSLRYEQRLTERRSSSRTFTAVFHELGYERDRMRKLDSRVAYNTGMSVPLSSSAAALVVLDFGVGINVEDYSTPEHTVRWGGLLRLSTGHRIFERARLGSHVAILPDIRTVGRYRVNSDAQIAAPITKAVSLRLSLLDRYDTRPAPSVKRNDFSIQSGVGVEF